MRLNSNVERTGKEIRTVFWWWTQEGRERILERLDIDGKTVLQWK